MYYACKRAFQSLAFNEKYLSVMGNLSTLSGHRGKDIRTSICSVPLVGLG